LQAFCGNGSLEMITTLFVDIKEFLSLSREASLGTFSDALSPRVCPQPNSAISMPTINPTILISLYFVCPS